MSNCKEVTRLLASEALEGAPLSLRARVRVHLLFCRHCRRYAAQLHYIGASSRALWAVRHEDEEVLGQLEASILAQTTGEQGAGSESTG